MVERKMRLAIVFVGLSLFAAPARAGETAPLEARALIERQLDAFAHDDAEGAYALAAPGIKDDLHRFRNLHGDGAAGLRAGLSPPQRRIRGLRRRWRQDRAVGNDRGRRQQCLESNLLSGAPAGRDVANQWLPSDQVGREQPMIPAWLDRAPKTRLRQPPPKSIVAGQGMRQSADRPHLRERSQ